MQGLEQGLQENPTYGIVVTGHSLGAVAAVYAAGELRAKYKDVELVWNLSALKDFKLTLDYLVLIWATTSWERADVKVHYAAGQKLSRYPHRRCCP